METTTREVPRTRRRAGRPLLYGEPSVRRTVDLPETLHTLIQRRVAEENFRTPHAPISAAQFIVDRLYEFFGLDNPKNG